jgi:hypothetical protein
MNYGIKRHAQLRPATKKNSEHAQFTEINLVQPTQVTNLSTLEFIRYYARLGFLTRIKGDFLPFLPRYLIFF